MVSAVTLAVALVLAVAAIATNPAWESPPPDASLLPPFEPPAVAAVIPDDDVVSDAFGTSMVRVRDRPPNTRAYQLNTDLAQDFRDAAIEQAWERRWRSPNLVEEAVVTVEIITGGTTAPPTVGCESAEPVPIAGTDAAGFRVRTSDITAACALIVRGRTHVGIQVHEPSGDDAHLIATLTTLVEHVEPLVEVTPEVPSPENIEMPRQRISMLRREMLGFALLLSVLVVVPIVMDRGLWRRLLTRFAPGRLNPLHTDVEPARRRWSLGDTALGACRLALILWAIRLAPTIGSHTHSLFGYAFIVLAYVVGLWFQRLLTRPEGRERRPLIRGAAMVPAMLGALGSVILLAVSFALWMSGSALTQWGSGTADFATWEVTGGGVAMTLVALVVALWVGFPTTLGRRWAMAAMRNRRRGDGRPVLMLRTFGDDKLKLRVRRPDRAGFLDSLLMKRREGFEELVALMLSSYGPPIAVGQPGQVLPPGLGAQRFTFGDDTWQDAVRSFAEEAELITVFIGKTAGLSWELELVSSSGYLHKTVFLVPPVPADERAERLAVFAAAYDLPPELFDTQTARRVPLAICWPLGSLQPVVASAASADDISYEVAIERCVFALSGNSEMVLKVNGLLAMPQYRDLGLPPAPRVKGEQTSNPLLPQILRVSVTTAAAIFIPLLTGNAMGDDGPLTRAIPFNDQYAVTTTLGGKDDEGWALVNTRTLVHGNFDSGSVTVVAHFDGHSLTAVRSRNTVFAIGSGWSGTNRQVSAMDLDTAQSQWHLDLPELTEGLAATDTAVYVTQPGARELWVIDPASGRLDAQVELDCTPWGVSARDTEAIVACPVEGRVVTLNHGVVTATQQAPVGTLKVLVVNDALIAYVPAKNEMRDLSNDSVLLLSVGEPAFAAAADALAVSGVDRVSLFTGADTRRWNTRPNVAALDISDDGKSLFYGSGSNWFQILFE